MEKVDVLIAGAGLTGLSCAYHLDHTPSNTPFKRKYLLVEKAEKVGGLSGSQKRDEFIFDCSGHLLHLHKQKIKSLLLKRLHINFNFFKRKSWIYSHNVYTKYPFQVNTYGLPKNVVSECVSGFLKAHNQARKSKAGTPNPVFKQWLQATFGEGICKHFMFPYSEKLWKTKLSKLSSEEWCTRFFPKPSINDVLLGAHQDYKKDFGYSAFLRYPRWGGCQVIPDTFAKKVRNIRLNSEVISVDPFSKIAVVKNTLTNETKEIKYDKLVSTLPLHALLTKIEEKPTAVSKAGNTLEYVSTYVLNLGINKKISNEKISNSHWVYFPNGSFPFYRIGIASNFSDHICPKGASSLYIEISRRPEDPFDWDFQENLAISKLKTCGILKESDKIITKLWQKIPYGYVTYNLKRLSSLETIFPFLNNNHICTIGRYGAWKYSFMEEAISDGKECAKLLLGITTPQTTPLRSLKTKYHHRLSTEKELKPLK